MSAIPVGLRRATSGARPVPARPGPAGEVVAMTAVPFTLGYWPPASPGRPAIAPVGDPGRCPGPPGRPAGNSARQLAPPQRLVELAAGADVELGVAHAEADATRPC